MAMKIEYREALAAGLLLLVGAGGALAQTDQVISHSGDTARGAIKKVTRDAIEIEERGNTRTIPASQIRAIQFGNEPRELRNGREAALGDKFEAALESLAKVKADDLARDEMKQDLAFYIAYAKGKLALAGGDRAAAEKELLDFARNYGDSYHFYDAAEMLGDLAYLSGSYDDAARRYAAIAKSSAPDQQMRGAYLEGKSLLAKGDPAAAMASFDQVIANPLNDPAAARVKALCEVGKARCLIESGKAAEGVALAQQVIDRNDPKDGYLFGAAYNALGAGYLKSEQPKQAVIAYLYVDLLFPSDPQSHAEALYYLEKLWTEQGKTDRAQACRNLLREQYGGTIWAKKG